MAAPTLVGEGVVAQQVSIFSATGRIQDVEHLLSPFGFTFNDEFAYPALPSDGGITHPMGLLYNSALRILLYRLKIHAKPQQALRSGIDLADLLISGLLDSNSLPMALQTLLLRSQLHAMDGAYQQSLLDVARAVTLGEGEGFISIFLEEGEPMMRRLTAVCTDHLLTASQTTYARDILVAFPKHETATKLSATNPSAKIAEGVEPLIEPLTSRELEVLKLIAAGNSNRDIGETLVITLSAVKKHTGNLFHKLSVNSRTQAIARARELGLLALNQ